MFKFSQFDIKPNSYTSVIKHHWVSTPIPAGFIPLVVLCKSYIEISSMRQGIDYSLTLTVHPLLQNVSPWYIISLDLCSHPPGNGHGLGVMLSGYVSDQSLWPMYVCTFILKFYPFVNVSQICQKDCLHSVAYMSVIVVHVHVYMPTYILRLMLVHICVYYDCHSLP